ncbi:MAG: formyltransferase [Sterolibacterium sp.]|jgi:methionyl-tRNA formyltransferase|nr:formyltransferase [Sterolibacterium sp.]
MTRAVVFAYHNVGVRCLSVLLAQGVEVALLVTHTDNPKETIWFDSVADLAALHGIPVITPDDPNDPAIVAQIAALQPDFIFSFYYRQMLKAPLLAIPAGGAWNMHGSLLPQYRGRVPVNWAVLQGARETGATLHRMLEKPDAGGILAQQAVPILPDDTAHEVFQKVTVAAEMALDHVLPQLLQGSAVEQPQNLALGRYYGGRKPEDGRIDWQQPAATVHNLIRAVAPPYPGAFCTTSRGELRVLKSFLPAAFAPPPPRVTPAPEPRLYEDNGGLYVCCGDARPLRLLLAELNGLPLTARNFNDICRTGKITLI